MNQNHIHSSFMVLKTEYSLKYHNHSNYIYIYKREHINIAIPFYDFKKSTQSQMLQINNIPIISLITNQQLNPKSNLYLESQPLSIKRSIQILHILMMNHPNSQPVTKITLNQHSMILKIEFNAKSQPAK
jgi:hypothetical protein